MEFSDAAQITNLLSRFTTLADIGSLDEIAATLADDVVWEMSGMTWTGKDAVVAGLGQMRAAGHAGPGTGTRHLVTNLQIEPAGSDAVRAHSYFIFIAAGSPPSTCSASIATCCARNRAAGLSPNAPSSFNEFHKEKTTCQKRIPRRIPRA